MTTVLLNDSTHAVRTVNIGIDGDEGDRIIYGSRIDSDFVADKLTVTATTDNSGVEDINVTVSGRAYVTGEYRSQDLGTALGGAPDFVKDALNAALPKSESFVALFVSIA